jgi:hypothetical protein
MMNEIRNDVQTSMHVIFIPLVCSSLAFTTFVVDPALGLLRALPVSSEHAAKDEGTVPISKLICRQL